MVVVVVVVLVLVLVLFQFVVTVVVPSLKKSKGFIRRIVICILVACKNSFSDVGYLGSFHPMCLSDS